MSLLDEDTGKIPVHTLESLLTDEPALDDTLIGSADQLRELLARTAPEAMETVAPNPAAPTAPAQPLDPVALPPAAAAAASAALAPPAGFRHLPAALPGGLSWSAWLVFGLVLGGGLSCGLGRLFLP